MSWRNNPTRVAPTTHVKAMQDMPSGVTLCPSRRDREARTESLSLRVLAPNFRVLRLPFATIERRNRHLLDRFRIDAPCVHADAIRMRARHVERFDAAHGTKQMLGRVSIETVGPERVAAAKQFKSIGGDHEVQVTGLAANGAVTFGYSQSLRGDDLKSDATTVTNPSICDHWSSPRDRSMCWTSSRPSGEHAVSHSSLTCR